MLIVVIFVDDTLTDRGCVCVCAMFPVPGFISHAPCSRLFWRQVLCSREPLTELMKFTASIRKNIFWEFWEKIGINKQQKTTFY